MHHWEHIFLMKDEITTAAYLPPHRIFTNEQRPAKRKPYVVSPEDARYLEETIERMLVTGMIAPSISEWGIPRGDCKEAREEQSIVHRLPRAECSY